LLRQKNIINIHFLPPFKSFFFKGLVGHFCLSWLCHIWFLNTIRNDSTILCPSQPPPPKIQNGCNFFFKMLLYFLYFSIDVLLLMEFFYSWLYSFKKSLILLGTILKLCNLRRGRSAKAFQGEFIMEKKNYWGAKSLKVM